MAKKATKLRTRTVRFYELIKLDKNGQPQEVTSSLWPDFMTTLEGFSPPERQFEAGDVTYVGETRRPTQPATPFVYFGRLRSRADDPDVYDSAGQLTQLTVPGNLSEKTFIVPFDLGRSLCAVMTPVPGSARPGAISKWINGVLGMHKEKGAFELQPIVNESLIEQVVQADGASSVRFRLPAGMEFPSDAVEHGEVLSALGAATRVAGHDMSVELAFSLKGRVGRDDERRMLRDAVAWVLRNAPGTKGKVSLQQPDEDGELRTVPHDLLLDRITAQGAFPVSDDEQPDERVVLEAISQAVQEYRRRT